MSEDLPPVPQEWGQKIWSKTHKMYYWKNAVTKEDSFELVRHNGRNGCICDCYPWGGLKKSKNGQCPVPEQNTALHNVAGLYHANVAPVNAAVTPSRQSVDRGTTVSASRISQPTSLGTSLKFTNALNAAPLTCTPGPSGSAESSVQLQIGNNFLCEYEGRHPWAFGAFAELIQNSDDANATRIDIHYFPMDDSTAEYLEFTDDGEGMSAQGMKQCFMLGDSRKGRDKDDTISGQYGVGFKQGVLRLGETGIVISRSNVEETISFGVLSNHPYYTEEGGPPKCAFTTLDLQGRDIPGQHPQQEIQDKIIAVLKHKMTKDSIIRFLFYRLGQRSRGIVGTSVYIFGVEERNKKFASNQRMDFKVQEKDIWLFGHYPDEHGNSHEAKYIKQSSVTLWKGTSIPLESSLREYCKVLFLKPRLEIWLLGGKVDSVALLEELTDLQIDKVRAGLGKEAPIVCHIGRHEWHKKRGLSGVFFYTANCLIKSYDYDFNCYSRTHQRSYGVLAIVSLTKSNLRVTPTKQEYQPESNYPSLLSNISRCLQNYVRPPESAAVAKQRGLAIIESWIQCSLCSKWRLCTEEYAKSSRAIKGWSCKVHENTKIKAAAMGCPEDPCQISDDYDELIQAQDEAAVLALSQAENELVDSAQGMASADILDVASSDFSLDENEILGEGRFANVYRGTWGGKSVAVKVFKPEILSDQFKSAFNREKKAALKTLGRFENVVCYMGFCSEKRAILMELMDSHTLRNVIMGEKLPLVDRLFILHEVAVGMSGVHSADVCHKDLKPENVMCSRADTMIGSGSSNDYVIKIVDFGISSLASADTQSIGSVTKFFSPHYSAPEQETASTLTPKVDVWSFGLMVVELCTCWDGTRLWGESDAVQIGKKKELYVSKFHENPSLHDDHLLEMLPIASLLLKPELNSELSGPGFTKLVDVVKEALHPDPERRPSFEKCKGLLMDTIEALSFMQLHGSVHVFHTLEPGDIFHRRKKHGSPIQKSSGAGRWALTRKYNKPSECEMSLFEHVQMSKYDFKGVILEIDVTKLPSEVAITDISKKFLACKHLKSPSLNKATTSNEPFCRAKANSVCAEEVVIHVGNETKKEKYIKGLPEAAIVAVYDIPAAQMELGGKFSGRLANVASKTKSSSRITDFRKWCDCVRTEQLGPTFWEDLKSHSKIEPAQMDDLLERIKGSSDEYWKQDVAEGGSGSKRKSVKSSEGTDKGAAKTQKMAPDIGTATSARGRGGEGKSRACRSESDRQRAGARLESKSNKGEDDDDE